MAGDVVHDSEEWARFNYLLLKQTSWLTRRVETWAYVGDARWCRSFSFDLNNDQIEEIWRSASCADSADASKFPSDEPLCLPLFDIDKRWQFSDLDLRDENGCAVHLLMRGASVQVTLNALVGAMQMEHPNDEFLQLQFDEPTVGFLGELFSSPLPPYTYKSTVSSSDGSHVEDVLTDAFKRLDEKVGNDFLAENVLWSEEDVAGVKRKLRTLVARSSVFRYFFRTYSMKWLACARIQLDGKRPDMVKGRYCVIRDMSKGRAGAPILRSLNPFSRGIALELELDGVGVGEVDHTTVQAPAGTYLSPSAKVKGSGKRVGWFSIKDDLSVRTELDTDLSGGPEAHAWGMLTPGHATVKTKKDWADWPDKRPLRRLPVDGSAEHRYLLSLNIAPRLGMRALGHLALFGLSALAFLMAWLNPELLSNSADTFSLGTLLVVASMLITALSSREEESYVRKLLFRLPQFLSVTCIAVDVVGFVYFLVAGLLASSSCGFLPLVPLGSVACAGFAVCAISFIWFLVWTANCAIRKFAWTVRPGAFETFKVQFHAVGEPRNITIPQD